MPPLRVPDGRGRQSTLSALTFLKLALVPFAVWLASLAARRWGHAVSGYLGGFPMIGGPITLYLAIDHGAEFAARSALVTMAAIAGQAAHMLAFSYAGRARGAVAGLAAGWTAYIFSGDPELPKLIRLAATKRTVLYNGAIECRLYEYRMVAGGNRP